MAQVSGVYWDVVKHTLNSWMSKKTFKHLKKKKPYYVRVRAFRESGNVKKYGKWSAVKKIKIKK